MMIKKNVTLISLLVAICFLAGPSLAAPKLKTAPGARSGLIKTSQHIYDKANPSALEVTVVLPRSLAPVWTGHAIAWLVIWMPGDTSEEHVAKMQLTDPNSTGDSDWRPDRPRTLFTIPATDLSNLQPGDYQMGLVLTYKGEEDPTNLESWYGGFSGLVSFTRLEIIDTTSPTADQETDGEPVEGSEEGTGTGEDPGDIIPY